MAIALVGPGNLAQSLVPALQQAGQPVQQVLARRTEAAQAFARQFDIPAYGGWDTPLQAEIELVIMTVADQGIAATATRLAGQAQPGRIFLHTSGSTSLSALAPLGASVGVLYPLQMFTKLRQVDFAELPLFLEGNESVLARIEPLARRLSSRVYSLDSTARLRMHLGAVMACNFSNLLFRLAEEQLADQPGLDFSVYRPLLQEQLRRVFELGPSQTQTGPAIRGDVDTMRRHLALLADEPEVAELYRELSRLINPEGGNWS
jgi:predicted short-subunit dehydrogenase-like oxidoreductase (DUF2520 family)